MVITQGKQIDYEVLMRNIDMMINTLEYDAMRSAGKMKLNAANINELYSLKDRYARSVKKTPTKKEG